MTGGKATANDARLWLRGVLESMHAEITDFITSDVDLNLEILSEEFPYRSGALPPELGGIASLILVQWAEETPSGFTFLRNILAGLVRSGEPVPGAWCEFHAGILDGTITAPVVKSGRSAVNDRRDELISLFVEILQQKFGLPQLANPLNRYGESALEIVRNELKPFCPGLAMVQLDALQKAIARRVTNKMGDPIRSVLDHRT